MADNDNNLELDLRGGERERNNVAQGDDKVQPTVAA